MNQSALALSSLLILLPALAQQPPLPRASVSGGAPSDNFNLPVEKIGRDDLLGITVYDSPELTRSVRVSSDGEIRLPMLRRRIHAAGMYPADLETAITTALIAEKVMVDPIVTVTVVEFRSRPISVVGAVKNSLTFQATGATTLLEAISQAQGLTEACSGRDATNSDKGAPSWRRSVVKPPSRRW